MIGRYRSINEHDLTVTQAAVSFFQFVKMKVNIGLTAQTRVCMNYVMDFLIQLLSSRDLLLGRS